MADAYSIIHEACLTRDRNRLEAVISTIPMAQRKLPVPGPSPIAECLTQLHWEEGACCLLRHGVRHPMDTVFEAAHYIDGPSPTFGLSYAEQYLREVWGHRPVEPGQPVVYRHADETPMGVYFGTPGLNRQMGNGTALSYARSPATVDLLLRYGADPFTPENGHTALLNMIGHGQRHYNLPTVVHLLDRVDEILRTGIVYPSMRSSTLRTLADYINAPGYYNQSAVASAVAQNNLELLQLLMDRGGNIGAVSIWFWCKGTLLHYAARLNRPNIALYLLDRGFDLTTTQWDKNGRTPW